jgi:hypothetical protein
MYSALLVPVAEEGSVEPEKLGTAWVVVTTKEFG